MDKVLQPFKYQILSKWEKDVKHYIILLLPKTKEPLYIYILFFRIDEIMHG
jgi:hypothetical protein